VFRCETDIKRKRNALSVSPSTSICGKTGLEDLSSRSFPSEHFSGPRAGIKGDGAGERIEILYVVSLYHGTVEGEMSVAQILVNIFSRVHFQTLCGCAPLPSCTPKVPPLTVIAERSQFLPILCLIVSSLQVT
jgi:hypothetical protein